MIDVTTETPVPFQEAGPLFPGRRKPHIASLHRWRLTGVLNADGNRVKLESVLVCGLRCTTKAAVLRFITAQNATDDVAPSISPKQRRQQSEAARKELASIGI